MKNIWQQTRVVGRSLDRYSAMAMVDFRLWNIIPSSDDLVNIGLVKRIIGDIVNHHATLIINQSKWVQNTGHCQYPRENIMIDFSKINQARKSMPIDPRDIFMALPNRKSPFEYPRDVQSEVWKKWYECRENKNNIIKMNTGSGKTVVGLIILQSCLHENCGPAVYVAPSYLISQIEAEAHALGIKTTQNEASLEYLDKKSILVINIQKLFNGKSVFGLREYNNIQIGSVIIDDVHACISDIEEQFSIRISRDCSAYNDLLALFSQSLKDQFFERYTDIFESGTSSMSCLVPFWIWQAKIDEVRKIINDELSDDSKTFRFPLISDVLNLCSCFCSFQAIEIIPPCIPR